MLKLQTKATCMLLCLSLTIPSVCVKADNIENTESIEATNDLENSEKIENNKIADDTETAEKDTDIESIETIEHDETTDNIEPAEQSGYDLETNTVYDLSSKNFLLQLKQNIPYTYTGKEIKPEIELLYIDNPTEENTNTEKRLIDPENYTVSYQNNINAGTATITVTGKEEYINSTSINFKINPVSIQNCTVNYSYYQTYNGKDIKPALTVTNGTATLRPNVDYQINYTNNKYFGNASFSIQGINNYCGSISKKFTIAPRSTTLTASSSSYKSIKLSWKKVSGIDSYILYRSTSPNTGFKKLKTLSKSSRSYTDKSVKLGKTYYYKIRTKKTIKVKNKKKTKKITGYSAFSPIVSKSTSLKATTLKSAKGVSTTSIKLSWKKCDGAQGYEVYQSNQLTGSYRLIKTTKSTSFTQKSLPVNTTWYYKVRAYRKSGSKKVYGAFSTIKAGSVKRTTVSGTNTPSGTGNVASSYVTAARLNELFPNGIPTSEAQMKPYLTNITVKVINAQGYTSNLTLTVHKTLAGKVTAIFEEMYNKKFPVLTSAYCYSWRGMTGSSKMSHHSYGCAIDINPASNPMIGYTSGTYAPGKDPYSVTPEVVKIWEKYGFYWGGYFNRAKDYMHFTYTGN